MLLIGGGGGVGNREPIRKELVQKTKYGKILEHQLESIQEMW